MTTTLELPDQLVKEIELLATQGGKPITDIVADLLRQGLDAAAAGNGMAATTVEAMLERRRAITQKFLSGEWGVELAGYEEGRAADRRKSAERANAWRE